ncbi:hypothetical protein ACUJ2E_005806, partial [Escherichia coli]
ILPPCEEGTTIRVVEARSGSPRIDRNISWGFIFPDLRVNLKPESFRHPPLSYPSSTKYLFIYTVNPVSDFCRQNSSLLLKRNRPQPSLTAGESVKQVPYHPDLTTGYAGIAPRTTATSSVRKREQP